MDFIIKPPNFIQSHIWFHTHTHHSWFHAHTSLVVPCTHITHVSMHTHHSWFHAHTSLMVLCTHVTGGSMHTRHSWSQAHILLNLHYILLALPCIQGSTHFIGQYSLLNMHISLSAWYSICIQSVLHYYINY